MMRKVRDTACAVLFFTGLIAALAPSADVPAGLRSTEAFWNLGHAALFFLFGHLVYTVYPSLGRSPLSRQVMLTAGMVVAAAGGIELAQNLIPGRTSGFADIVVSLAGAGVYVSLHNRQKTGICFLFHAGIICLALFAAWPCIKAVSDEIIAKKQFPLLAGFETPFEKSRFEPNSAGLAISTQKASTGNRSLKIRLRRQTYSGVSLQYMPRNWKGFSSLNFSVYNPQDHPVRLTVRIHDKKHEKQPAQLLSDRFNRFFPLAPQNWTPVSIPLEDVHNAPLSRGLNLARVQTVGFFTTHPPEPCTLFIDSIRLD